MAGPKCGKCSSRINRYEDNIECSGPCGAVFHLKCTDISLTSFTNMKTSGDIDSWTCVVCDENKSMASEKTITVLPSNPTLTDVVSILNNLLVENIKLQKSVAETHKKLDAQTSHFNELLERVKELEDENKRLVDENLNLQISIDEQEQYSRRNCLEIHGLPEFKGENTLSEVIKMGRVIGVELKPDAIDNCHRLGRRPKIGEPPAARGIIVKFVRNFDKNNFLRCRKVKTNLNARDLGFTINTPIYVNENLTQFKRSLMSRARKMKSVYNLAYVWSRNGNIYVRVRENSDVKPIKTEKDLDSIERYCKDLAQRVLNNTNV